MNTRELITFVTLAKYKNYLKAAEELSYAPSALSKQIHVLEEEMGTYLVTRVNNRIELTESGDKFLQYANKMLDVYYESKLVLSQNREMTNIRIGGGEPIIGYSMSDLFLRMTKENPDLHMPIQMICCARVPSWIKNEEIDVGYIHEMGIYRNEACESIPLYSEPVHMVVSKDHPLAAKKDVKLCDFQKQNFAYTYEDCCFTAEFRNRMKDREINPKSELFLGSFSAVLNCVSQGNYVALVPHTSFRTLKGTNIVPLDMDEDPICPVVQIVCGKEEARNPQVQKLICTTKCYSQNLITESQGQVVAV